MQREVMFYTKEDGDAVRCRVCPKLCRIPLNKRGFCRVRENRAGVLYAANYGQCSAAALDPMEKKPLYHFYPGSRILSLGTVGCNFHCGFCQNWHIAQQNPPTRYISPAQAVDLALDQKAVGIAYTYSEPLMWYEYVYDTAQLAQKAGLKNVLVTNGYINREPLHALLPFVDAMNIDVKAFTDDFYRQHCQGELKPVLRTVEESIRHCHVEITTLLITGLNDGPQEIRQLVDWLADLDPSIPLHFSRYTPHYQMDLPATPLPTLLQARQIARRKLQYVYVGNAPELNASDTFCPGCQSPLVDRTGYRVQIKNLKAGVCTRCGQKVPVVM